MNHRSCAECKRCLIRCNVLRREISAHIMHACCGKKAMLRQEEGVILNPLPMVARGHPGFIPGFPRQMDIWVLRNRKDHWNVDEKQDQL